MPKLTEEQQPICLCAPSTMLGVRLVMIIFHVAGSTTNPFPYFEHSHPFVLLLSTFLVLKWVSFIVLISISSTILNNNLFSVFLLACPNHCHFLCRIFNCEISLKSHPHWASCYYCFKYNWEGRVEGAQELWVARWQPSTSLIVEERRNGT